MTVATTPARADAPAAHGVWLEPKSGASVATYACAEDARKLCGRIVRVPADGPQHDRENPDPALRGRALLGLEIVTAFSEVAPQRWEGGGRHGALPGRIYLPANGDTLGDHRNRYVIAVAPDRLVISVANCSWLNCLVTSEWTRLPAAPR
ncbi:MAG: DUF2147 domain-containing protein [Gammaproteobacteria bacterium]